MDGNGIRNFRDFGLLEPSNNALHYKGYNFDLQLMSSMAENPFYGGSGIHSRHETDSPSVMPSHHHRVGGVPTSMDFWLNHNREKYLIDGGLSGSNQHGYYQPNNGVSPETSSNHSIQMSQQITLPKTENVIPHMGGSCEERDNVSSGSGCVLPKKRAGGKLPKSPPKEKKAKTRAPRTPKDITSASAHRSRVPKKRAEIVINGINMDISGIPIPICSCTGTPQQCYRWGSGGWQSACCTTGMSVYPLPMSTKRRGARIAGRKMSIGAFKKVLEKLASEGYNFSNPIDLRSFWAKHGTNKFVTIR